MERLIKSSQRQTGVVKKGYKRFLYTEIDWAQSLSIVLGHCGEGKTTLLRQRVKELKEKAIYLWMTFTLKHIDLWN